MAKSLKEQNSWKLWLILAANASVFYAVIETGSLRLSSVASALVQAGTLVPVGVAGVLATVLNALLSADLKARLVFWRWKYALPGHRAFSHYAGSDPRIDVDGLAKSFKGGFPTAPAEQNAAWYNLYKTVQNNVVVSDAHKSFLLLRDYTGLSVILLVVFIPAALLFVHNRGVALPYAGLLIVQYLVVRQGASNTGVRMVTNVMALKATPVR